MTQLAPAQWARARLALSPAVRHLGRGAALPKAALAAALSVFLTGFGTGGQFGVTGPTASGAAGTHAGRLVLTAASSTDHIGHLVATDDRGSHDEVGNDDGSVARIATFNVLGASHTAPGGNSRNHIDGRTRMRWTVKTLTKHGIDIVGLQEFEPVQEATFLGLAGDSWDHFPKSGGEAGSANVVAWRSDLWAAVWTARLPVPYFHGHLVGMPYVLLENAAHRRVWVMSVHNPADTRGRARRWRAAAVRAEANLVAQLHADGTPVILSGDMNDRKRFFCAITGMAPVHAANGGGTGGSCQPPAPMGIDWIVGTSDVTFSGYISTRHSPIDRASDHSMVYADIALR
jgi:endonuclease/exonuclease/phosphatase family metal-dependent hydrolase